MFPLKNRIYVFAVELHEEYNDVFFIKNVTYFNFKNIFIYTILLIELIKNKRTQIYVLA